MKNNTFPLQKLLVVHEADKKKRLNELSLLNQKKRKHEIEINDEKKQIQSVTVDDFNSYAKSSNQVAQYLEEVCQLKRENINRHEAELESLNKDIASLMQKVVELEEKIKVLTRMEGEFKLKRLKQRNKKELEMLEELQQISKQNF